MTWLCSNSSSTKIKFFAGPIIINSKELLRDALGFVKEFGFLCSDNSHQKINQLLQLGIICLDIPSAFLHELVLLVLAGPCWLAGCWPAGRLALYSDSVSTKNELVVGGRPVPVSNGGGGEGSIKH